MKSKNKKGGHKHNKEKKKFKPFKAKTKTTGDESKKKKIAPMNRKTKVHIKFDNQDRKNYLKGFHKRKEERRRVAKVQYEENVKKEIKQIRSERRLMLRKMIYHEMPEDIQGIMDPDTLVTTCGSATVEISSLDLTAEHPGISRIPSSEVEKEQGEDDGIPVYTKENLEELGIFNQKDLKKSVRKSAGLAMKKSKVMRTREKKHARQQRKFQRQVKTGKRRLHK